MKYTTHNPRRGTRRFMGSTGAAALSRAMRRKSQMAPFVYKPQRPALNDQLVVIGRKAYERQRVFNITHNATGVNPTGLVRIGNEIRFVVRRNKNMWVSAPGPRGVRNIGWIDPDLLRYEGHADLLQENPRKGTRRYGGSTQAAARARRAPAPAASAPAPAPKKGSKAKTAKSSLSPASLKMLFEATAGTIFSTWDNNRAKPVFIGSVTLDGVSRSVVANLYAMIFTDTISEKTVKLLRRNVNYSAQQPNIEGLSDSIQKELRNSEEVTSNFFEKSRLNNAQVKRGKIVEYDTKRFIGLSFLLSSGKVETFDLQKLKHLSFTTGATRLEIGGRYAFFYKKDVLTALLISLDTTKGEGGSSAYWENGTPPQSYLVAIGQQKPEIIKAPNLKTSPLRVKMAKLPGKAESLGSFFGKDAKKVKISDSENWLFCNSGGLSQAHLTATAQKFLSDYLQGFTSYRALNYQPDYDPSRRAFVEKILKDSREAQPAFYDSVIKYKVYDEINKVVQVITNDQTTNGVFSIDRVKLLAKQLYFDEFRLFNGFLYVFYQGKHVGLITPVRGGGEIVE